MYPLPVLTVVPPTPKSCPNQSARSPLPPQVRVPLGLAAELLRAGCIAASAETALTLISSTVVTPQRGVSTFAGGSGTATVLSLLLGLLRILACATAGAAVSCVGGNGNGSGGEERRRGRSNPSPAASRSAAASSSAAGHALPVAVAASASTPSSRAASEASGSVGRGDQEAMRGDAAEALPPRPAAPAWCVPSGALGGAFYALTAGGVFEGVMREYVLGEFELVSRSSLA